MKKWMALVLAVGFILTASFSAQADSVLLPWVVKDSSISTIVTVVNTFDPTPMKVRFHLMYWYKLSTDNKSTEACEEVNFCVPTSFNDIIVFDAAGNFNGGSPLFGDTAVQGTKYTTVQGTSLALPVTGPRRAYLIITNEAYTNEVCGAAAVVGQEDSIYAEAMVVDIKNGAAWGYDGYNPRNTNITAPLWWANFADNATVVTDALGQIVASDKGEFAFLTIMPPDVGITTKLFVTPVGPSMFTNGGTYRVISKLYCDIPTLGGMFDYDERCISFDTAKEVVCTDASTIDQYVSSGAWTIFRNTKAEGWAYLFLPAQGASTRQAAIGKLEYSVGAASFDGNRIAAAINNFIWVRGR
ncbi:MAG: hypothetical protein N2260_02025 [Syntrophobacterales bacterium]|nr:hypothetical protein [Syntrophobacterales bacterium]